MADTLTPQQKAQLLHSKFGIQVFIRDPIDNGRVMRDDTRNTVFEWCFENCNGKFWVGMGFGRFELEEDATLFKLRWL
jgi:hypothetical protein